MEKTLKIKFYKIILIIFILFFSFKSVSQQISCDTFFLKTIIYTLSSDSMEGRRPGNKGAEKAKNFLINYFQKNTKTTIDSFTYNLENKSIKAENIVGIIDNKADSFIIFMAHYDHIGYGGEKSRSLTNNKIHPGADDNASGIAIVLHLINYFAKKEVKKEYKKKINFLFIALSGHEDGLYGSKNFVTKYSEIIKKTKIVLNYDMVGRLNYNTPIIKLISNDICHFKKYLNDGLSITFHYSEDYLNSDIEIFARENIKCLSITTGIHDDYHKTSDTADKINYEGVCKIVNLTNYFVKNITSRPLLTQ